VIAAAPAKVNLWLHVGRKREDGYHALNSLVVFADIADQLEAEPADALSLAIDGPFAEGLGASDNLALAAARRLADAAGLSQPGARLRLTKNIPVAAGLGGGSADAAAALRLLNALWDLGWSNTRLQELAAGLGADVPVCVSPRPTVISGVGERLAPLEAWPELHAVLVNPGIALSTAEVFLAHDVGRRDAPHDLQPPLGISTADTALALVRSGANDLEAAAQRLCPDVGAALEAIGDSDGCRLARMSGSGASCFGFYDDARDARDAAAAINVANPEWWVAPVRLAGCGDQ